MRKPRTALGQIRANNPMFRGGQVRVEVGIEPHPKTGEDMGFLKVGTITVYMDANRADEYSTDFRRIALELRNGGMLV